MMRHNVEAWREIALEIGLKVTQGDSLSEIEITTNKGSDQGILWVSPLDMVKIEPGDPEVKTVDPGQALAVLGRLHRMIK